jgi:hypothetical protein
MSENVKLTSIQRNEFDVAVELTQLHCEVFNVKPDDIKKIFAEYFSLARTLNYSSEDTLINFLSEDIKKKL